MPPNQFNQYTPPTPTMQNTVPVQNSTQQPPQNTPTYAGFWIRFAAMLVDGMIFQIISTIIVVVIVIFVPSVLGNELLKNIIIGLYNVSFILYYVLTQSGVHQATIGKRLAGIKVVHSADMSRITFGRSLGRELSKIVSYMILAIGFLMIGFTSKKQGLHDMMAGTLVIKEKPARVGAMLSIIIIPFVIQIIVIVVMGGMFLSALFNSVGKTDYSNTNKSNQEYIVDTPNSTNKDLSTDKTSVSETKDTGTFSYIIKMTSDGYDKALFNTTMKDYEIENPGAYVGPGIIEIHNEQENTNGIYSQIVVFLPQLPNIKQAKVRVFLSHVYSKTGIDVFGPTNLNETDVFFEVPLKSENDEEGFVYFEGVRNGDIEYKNGKDLSLKTLDSVQGVLDIELPLPDGTVYSKKYPFTIKNK